jgi:tetratricopeptide (TPR) repeat protein
VYELSQVAAICARLDYLPLAIELAAAQTGALPPPMLLERLSQRLHVLRDGPRDLPDRQRTMEATLDWSYDLLTGERQAVFRALSVFASGWTLDAAIALRSPDTSPTPEETILTLAALVDASLVQVDILPAAPIRWRLLDITREYALARLRATGEEEAYLRRAAEYLAHLGETALTLGPERRVDGARLDLELPNARLALEWAEQRREADIGLRLAGFARVWHACGQPREAVDWLDRMLALDAQARASGGLVAPPTTRVSRLYGLARAVLGCGDPQLAERRLHEAISLASSLQDHGGMAEAFATLGDIAQADSRLELAMAAYTESSAHARLAPDGYPMHRALAQLAELARLRGDMTQAEQRLEEALASARAGDSSWEIAIVTSQLGRIARVRNRYAKARAYYQESLSFFGAFEASAFTARSLEGLAATLTAEGRHAPSVRLYAGSAAIRQRCGSPAPAADRDAIEEALARARIALGEPLYRAEWSTGAALSSDALITEALAHASGERALAPSPRVKKRGR